MAGSLRIDPGFSGWPAYVVLFFKNDCDRTPWVADSSTPMSSPLPELELRDPVTDAEVRITPGARFVIHLTENPTTGFRWNYDVTEQGVVELLEDDYVSHGNLPGSGGCRSFSFRGSLLGTTRIKFVLRRAWETGPPLKVLLVSATVAHP
jgi:predicted secreted protein